MTSVVAVLAGAALCASAAAAGTAPGGRVVFASASGGQGKVRVWAMNANGSARRALTSGLRRFTSWRGEQYWPSWAR